MEVRYMEVKEYLEKYNLENEEHFPYDKFIGDLKMDFDDLVKTFDAMESMKSYRFCINSLRAKWESISKNSFKPLPEVLWNSIYKTHIAEIRKSVKGYDEKVIAFHRKNMLNKGKNYDSGR